MAESSKLKTFYHRYLPAVVFLTVVAWATIRYFGFQYYPPVGAYIAILGLLAALVTIFAPEGRWGKVFWIAVFALVMIFEIQNLYHDRSEHDRQMEQARTEADARQTAAEKQLQQGFGSILQTQQKSFSEMLGENQKQFYKTLKSTEAIQALAQESIKAATGGDSFCDMYLSPQLSSKGLTPTFDHIGREPLYDIHVQIVDIEKLAELEKQSKSNGRSLPFLNEANLYMPIANMRPNSAYIPGEYGQIVLTGDSTVHNFNAYFDARNGDWNENLQLRRVGNQWSEAMRVWRWTGRKYVLMCQTIPKDFPGVPDWPALKGVKFPNARLRCS
jgi:hypothetical protein